MPFQPQHSLLRVEVSSLQSIDTSSVENLFGMWSLFSKASHAMEDGKRLENLSWRLWNREIFCCSTRSHSPSPSTPTLANSARFAAPPADADDVPSLSSSLDSASSQEDESASQKGASKTRPARRRTPSHRRSRGHEKHITSDGLASIVETIKQNQSLEPLDLNFPTADASLSSITATTTTTTTTSTICSHDLPERLKTTSTATSSANPPAVPKNIPLESSSSTVDTEGGDDDNHGSPTDSSDGSSNTEMSTHSIVRGFVPGGAPSSYRSQTNLAAQPTPIVTTPHKFRSAAPKKRGPMFTIGTSSGEDESSFESHMYKSSLSESLNRAASDSSRKHNAIREELAIGGTTGHSPVFETDEEDEEVSESAIEEDDDSSDWEDSDDGSRPSSVTDKALFQRVGSRPDLTSRRSLLTTLMHEPDRARALANAASRSTPAMRRSRTATPNGPSVATSPESGHQMPAAVESSRGAQPIITTTSTSHPIQMQLALSPRTTRRNMLSTELTESLRKNLLWERQHRSSTSLAALRRRHTSTDVKNLRQQPEPGPVLTSHDGTKNFSNDYFHQGLQEYHAKGW